MPIVDAKTMSPSEAIAAANNYFQEFFGNEKVENKLLEELDFNAREGTWAVTIGFDVGRTKMRQPSLNALASLTAEVIPVREARKFIIRDDDGGLVKMEVV